MLEQSRGAKMASGQTPTNGGGESRFQRALFAVCGGVGCFLGLWFGPRLTGWNDPNSPDPFSALAGMGVGFALATIISGLVPKAPPRG
jgi:hypothetical protein